MRLISCGLLAWLGVLAALAADLPQGGGKDSPTRESEAEIAYNDKVLRDAGLPSDPAGLLTFFRSQVLSEADQQRLKQAVVNLGNEQFEVREKASQELIEAGRFSLPLLRPLLEDSDLERVRRAERCIEEIQQKPVGPLITAAAILSSIRRPAGVTQAMLASLPWVEEESVRDAIFAALTLTGLRDGRAEAVVLEAATDPHPIKRAAAAHLLGRASMEQRQQAVHMLVDSDIRVRFHAACSLLRSGEKVAVAPLLAQLTDGPLTQAWQAEDLLCRLAGERLPAIGLSSWDEAGRSKCREAWEMWWQEQKDRLDLTRVNLEESYLRLNVIAELDGSARGGGRIWECGPDGKVRWEILNVSRPIDVQLLPGGRVLVAEHGNSRVSERDREGKVLWEFRVEHQPVSVQRLLSGNTFIVTYNELLEVTPSNKVVFSVRRPGMIYHGAKLRNGNMVYVTSNSQVVELDPTGREVRMVPVGNTSGWASVEKLNNGNYLVALYSGRKVVEVNESGKVLWECQVESPGHATRLRDGNVLVASIEGRKLLEINRSGAVVWQQATQGRPFHVHRR
jgi:hypothetical protein